MTRRGVRIEWEGKRAEKTLTVTDSPSAHPYGSDCQICSVTTSQDLKSRFGTAQKLSNNIIFNLHVSFHLSLYIYIYIYIFLYVI